MAGDPSLERTVEIALALDEAGADAIELGVPFSDPLADGPSIQAAGQRALERGATVPKVLDTLHAIRGRSEIPIVLMTYYNPALAYGVERFAQDAASAGADGAGVGSALVDTIARAGDNPSAAIAAGEFAAGLKAATKAGFGRK